MLLGVDELVPVGPVTITWTAPADLVGATAVISPSLLTVNEAGLLPKRTLVAPANPPPLMSTEFPPAVGPALGDRPETAGTQVNWSLEEVPVVPFDVVAVMSTGPPDPGGLIASRCWASMKNTVAGVDPKFTDVPP